METNTTKRLVNPLVVLSGHRPEAEGYELVNEVALDSLIVTQNLLIETANSAYCFSVTDPAERLGLLIGGVLRGRQVLAFLAGALAMRTGAHSGTPRLSVGSRAIFLLTSERGIKRVVTSRITRLGQKLRCLSTATDDTETRD